MLWKSWVLLSFYNSFLVLSSLVALLCLIRYLWWSGIGSSLLCWHFRGQWTSAEKHKSNTVGWEITQKKRREGQLSTKGRLNKTVWNAGGNWRGNKGGDHQKVRSSHTWVPFLGRECTYSPITLVCCYTTEGAFLPTEELCISPMPTVVSRANRVLRGAVLPCGQGVLLLLWEISLPYVL